MASHLVSCIALSSSLPLVVVNLEPQWVFLALKSPPTMNQFPKCPRNSRYSYFFNGCLGGQYIPATTIEQFTAFMRTAVACIPCFIFCFFMVMNILVNYDSASSPSRSFRVDGMITFIAPKLDVWLLSKVFQIRDTHPLLLYQGLPAILLDVVRAHWHSMP